MPALNLPPEVADVLRSFYTSEITTVGAQGQPMTWPAVTYFDEANGQFFFAVSIAFPVKAQNARRRPHVSLLYSDPTGSQLADPPAVLVQGDATVADVLDLNEPNFKGLSDLVYLRQPESRAFSSNKIGRRLFDWYLFKRIGVTVTPKRLLVWPNRDFSVAPQTIELMETVETVEIMEARNVE